MRAEAGNYPGQETQIMDFFRKNPKAVDTLRGPIFEEKAVDLLLGQAKVIERAVTAEELARDPDEIPASAAPGAEVGAGETAPDEPAPDEPAPGETSAGEMPSGEPAPEVEGMPG